VKFFSRDFAESVFLEVESDMVEKNCYSFENFFPPLSTFLPPKTSFSRNIHREDQPDAESELLPSKRILGFEGFSLKDHQDRGARASFSSSCNNRTVLHKKSRNPRLAMRTKIAIVDTDPHGWNSSFDSNFSH
jgi:hypothetical protein